MIGLELFNIRNPSLFLLKGMPCFYNECRRRKSEEAFWGKRATNYYYLWGMRKIPKIQPKNRLASKDCSLRCRGVISYTLLLHTKDWMKSFSSFNLCVWACVCTSVYYLKCGSTLWGPPEAFTYRSHTFNGLKCPQCSHNVSTPIDVNAVLVGFFFDFYFICFSPSTLCVCEDANVTHKVSIV